MCHKSELGLMAVKSMVYEVSATPKPGLVDRWNSGAHNDMDYQLFLQSSISFSDCLEEMVEIGYEYQGDDYKELFKKIRKVGIRAEGQMFQTTKGVNTHKGILFSLGILCCAAGHILGQKNNEELDAIDVCEIASKMVAGITVTELHQMNQERELSHGERLFLKYGVTGIRGEAENGFQSVRRFGLPVLIKHHHELELNELLIQVLFSLMTEVDDTNILHRHNEGVLEDVKIQAKKFLDQGGMMNPLGEKEVIYMNEQFTNEGISPGGSADLLAVTVFLGMIQGMKL